MKKRNLPEPGQVRFIECTRRRVRLEERRKDGWWRVTSTGLEGMPISLLMHEQYLKTYSKVEKEANQKK